jgi:uncharacterized protein (DUF952 family)
MVVNAWFQGWTGLVMLCIDPDKVQSTIRYEAPPGFDAAGETLRFPHIYGPLNVDAVFKVVEFDPGDDGTFVVPDEIAALA